MRNQNVIKCLSKAFGIYGGIACLFAIMGSLTAFIVLCTNDFGGSPWILWALTPLGMTGMASIHLSDLLDDSL